MPLQAPAITAGDVDDKRLVDELRVWVGMESHTPDADAVSALAAHVRSTASAAGLETRLVPGPEGYGDALIVSHGNAGAEKGILVLAHLDTVHAAGTIDSRLPWREEGNRIYGPGVYDMKAGALMALEALRLAVATGNGPKHPVTILFTPDEETGSVSSRGLIEEAGRRASHVLVVEPARDGGKIVTARKGVAMYDVVVEGRASHAGSKPEEGRSAIREAARVVLELEALNDPARGVSVTVGTIHGGTGRNTVPAECRLQVDIRVPDNAAAGEVLPKIEAVTSSHPDIRVRVTGGLNRPPFAQSERGRALFADAAGIASGLGIDLVGVSTGGGSDGNFTAGLGVPTLDGLGADGNGAHTFDEHIFRDSLGPRTALLANLMLTLDE